MKFKNSLKQRILIKPFIYKRESLSVQSLKIIFLLMIQVLMLLFTKTYNYDSLFMNYVQKERI